MAGRCDTWTHKQLHSLVDRCFMIQAKMESTKKSKSPTQLWYGVIMYPLWIMYPYLPWFSICSNPEIVQILRWHVDLEKYSVHLPAPTVTETPCAYDTRYLARQWGPCSLPVFCWLGTGRNTAPVAFGFNLYLFLQIWKAIVAHSSCPEPTAVPPWWLDSELPMTPPSSKVIFTPSTLAISQWNAFSRCLSMMVIASLWYLQGGKMVNHKWSWGEKKTNIYWMS